MPQWEYFTRTFYADKDDNIVKEYLQQFYPNWAWKDVPKHHPVTLEAHLDYYGRGGWELVSVELVDYVGKNGDLAVSYELIPNWRKAFFCVFKRPKQEAE